MIRVALVGYPRVGKDSIADHLVERHGFEKFAFADPLKEMLARIDPIYAGDVGLVELFKKKNLANTREKLQNLGMEMRDIDSNFWVDKLLDKIYDCPSDRIVVTDVRFDNEFDALVDEGFTMIGVERRGCGPVNDHISEDTTGRLFQFVDHIVHNDASIEEAAESVFDYAR